MAYSIHRLAVSGVLALSLLAGCQRTGVAPVAKMNPTPMITDEAMAIRNWDQSRALYSNGSVIAYPTLFPYQSDAENNYYANVLIEPALLVAQTAALPITAVVTPPWTPVNYHGVYVDPTYTADVPLDVIP